jgi:hypothetical protein
MVTGDWGLRVSPEDFGGWAALDGEFIESNNEDDLPEIVAACEAGWFTLTEAPLWCFIPAIWPDHARAWVRDRRVRHSGRVPWTAAAYFDIEDEYNQMLGQYGLPPRPGGRIRGPPSARTLRDCRRRSR